MSNKSKLSQELASQIGLNQKLMSDIESYQSKCTRLEREVASL